MNERIISIVAAVAATLVLALAAWGLVGSILYAQHSEMLQSAVVQQANQIQQLQVVAQQRTALAQVKHDSLQAFKQAYTDLLPKGEEDGN